MDGGYRQNGRLWATLNVRGVDPFVFQVLDQLISETICGQAGLENNIRTEARGRNRDVVGASA